MPIINTLGNKVSSRSSSAADDHLKVYIYSWSQSNMGAGDSTGLTAPYTGTQNAWIYNPETGVIERMNVGVNTDWQGYPTPAHYPTGFGAETAASVALTGKANNRVLVIKYLVVGSNITLSSPKWSYSDNTINATAKTTILNALSAAETFFSLPKSKIDIKGLIRMQGEADADNAGSSQALWKSEHTTVTNDIITTLNGLGYNVYCRLVTGRIKTFSPPRVHENEIRAAIVDFADNYISSNPLFTNYVAGSTWIDNDPLTTDGGGVHYDQASNVLFGQNVGAALAPYVYEKLTPTVSLMGEDSNGEDEFEDGSTDIFENRLT